MAALFVNGSGRNVQSLCRTLHSCFLPSFGSFGQAIKRRFFRNRPNKNKNCLWWPCLLMDQDEMSNLYNGPSFHRCFLPSSASFVQAGSEKKGFWNWPIRNKNCLWWPCLLTNQNEMNNHNRGSSIDASYQVSVHLAQRFQRRRLQCEK
jgi:Zn-finger protein